MVDRNASPRDKLRHMAGGFVLVVVLLSLLQFAAFGWALADSPAERWRVAVYALVGLVVVLILRSMGLRLGDRLHR